MILEQKLYSQILKTSALNLKQLAVLIDPDKFDAQRAEIFISSLPQEVTHIFVGGSTDVYLRTETVVSTIKLYTALPIILFPGDYKQITNLADAILYLSLISGQNPEYLINQQVKSVSLLKNSNLEIIPTGYILIDGGQESSVERVSNTKAIAQDHIEKIVDLALAAQYLGKKIIYLEAGSGAKIPVSLEIIKEVKYAVNIPVIVGGGIKTKDQLSKCYLAGADMVVVGTAFEQNNFIGQL